LALDPEDRAPLRRALADRFYSRGLRALRDREPANAVRNLRFSSELDPDRREVIHWLRIAEGLMQPINPIAEHAGRRVQDHQGVRDLALLKQLEERSARTEGLLAQGRPSAARDELEKLLRWEDWTGGSGSLPIDAQALSRETERRILAEVGTGRGPQDLRRECRRASGRVLAACEELVDLSFAEGRQPIIARPAAGNNGERSQGGRSAAQEKILAEMERLLARGEDLYGQRTPGSGNELWRRPFQELQILSQWFPELDMDRRLQRLVQEYLGR